MKEIKFRVFVESVLEEETGMYTPKYISSWQNGTNWDIDKVYTDGYKFTEDTCKFTLMQYTGLRDKNGVEIYEGDILTELGMVKEVQWSDEGFGWVFTPRRKFENNYTASIEVIGNLYENPTLLETPHV